MKPVKNHYFCIGAYRAKMLFKEKHNADNFIRFNAEEIYEQTGKAPVRSYYCQFCGGWHVTSVISAEEGKKKDEIDNNRFVMMVDTKANLKKKKPIVNEVKSSPNKAVTILDIFSKMDNWISALKEGGESEYISIHDEYKNSKASFGSYCHTLEDKEELKRMSKRMEAKLKLKKAELIHAACFGKTRIFAWLQLCDNIENCTDIKELNDYKTIVNELNSSIEYLHNKLCLKTWSILNAGLDRLKKQFAESQERLIHPTIGQDSEKYKVKLLSLIDSLEQVRHCYGEGKIEDGLKMVSEGLTELKGFDDDKNVSILKRHYLKWLKLYNVA